MRLALDLRPVADPADRERLAADADRLGLWAVLIGSDDGTAGVEAARLAVATTNLHLAVTVDVDAVHPFAAAEELAVIDHLSRRRVLAVARGDDVRLTNLRRLLGGHIVDGVAVAPPPAQTAISVWIEREIDAVELSGDLPLDRSTIDDRRDSGVSHLFVSWPGDLPTLARHLATRAATPDFPDLVADMADRLPTHDT